MISALQAFVLAVGSSLPASIVAKATFILAFGLIGARLACRQRAAVRHVLLAAVFGVLLFLPVASIIVPPVRIAVRTAAQDRAALLPLAGSVNSVPLLTLPGTHYAATPVFSRSPGASPATLLLLGWLAGVALTLIPLLAGLWKIRWLRRSALPWTAGQEAVDRLALQVGIRRRVEVLLHESLLGPIASGAQCPAILLSLDAQTWQREDLNRALVHELEHVRRGDVVTRCLARAVCAVYWFHPLVWFAWRHLMLEAERSCDDAVLGRSDATAYADQLVGLARRLSTAAKPPLLAMANRADLAIRVVAVLDSRQQRGRVGPSLVALVRLAAALFVLTISPLRTVSAPQSASGRSAVVSSPPIGSGVPTPSFEVASIKLNRSGAHNAGVWCPRGRFIATNTRIRTLIGFAYHIPTFQVTGGPGWLDSDHYDIEAKQDEAVVDKEEKLPFQERMNQFRFMLRSLFAERFNLKLSHQTRELPVYALIVAKGGHKLLEQKSGEQYPNGIIGANGRPMGSHTMGVGPGGLSGQGVFLAEFVGMLSQQLNRAVVDQTGLKGAYDISLHWTPDPSANPMRPGHGTSGADAPLPDSSGLSIFTAIQEQLGLKLESTKGPVGILVIDHIERPSEN